MLKAFDLNRAHYRSYVKLPKSRLVLGITPTKKRLESISRRFTHQLG